MRIVLLCGSQHNQVALANKLAMRFELAGMVVEKRAADKTSFSLPRFIEKVLNKTVFISLTNAWFGLMDHYKKKYPSFPAVRSVTVDNINSNATVDFIKELKPDLLVVSGTSMLRKKILEVKVPKGILNLHTGLSPYIKGGPNCTNWCIADNKMHLIGNTVMWIDAGIDSGDIVTTALTALTGEEDLTGIHIKVMDHAHDLYLSTVKQVQDDITKCPRVKQSSITTSGILYYNRQWNWKAKLNLLRNMKKAKTYFNSAKYREDISAVLTVPLN